MIWDLLGSNERVEKALREKTQSYDVSPNAIAPDMNAPRSWLDIAYAAANADMGKSTLSLWGDYEAEQGNAEMDGKQPDDIWAELQKKQANQF